MTLRNCRKFKLSKPQEWRKKALIWGNKKKYCAYTNPNNQSFPFEPFREILAAGSMDVFKASGGNDFGRVYDFHQQKKDWIFGYFGYDLKNQIESLISSHEPKISHPDIFFFQPLHVLIFNQQYVEIHTPSVPEDIFEEINSTNVIQNKVQYIDFSAAMEKEEYICKVQRIREHIINGDIYELNLCMEFFAEKVIIDPLLTYHQLIELSPTPFSGYLRNNDNYLISASPERFIKKTGKDLLSQPIKGTARRDPNRDIDLKLKNDLFNNEKERAENMMIVDLVRNDLARSSVPGSVKAEELFGIYSFRHWHQMISTVSGESRNDINWAEIIKNAFPMGSMTGAPKIKVMELIDKYENSRRGVYSGAFGYVTPNGNFDFNVVIRSLLYDALKSILSFQVGSAITYDSVPQDEFEECMLKASAIFQLFQDQNKKVNFIPPDTLS